MLGEPSGRLCTGFLWVLLAGLAVGSFGPDWVAPPSLAADASSARVMHGPYSAGRCTVCHTSHEAPSSHGLVSSERQLCFYCHKELERDLAVGVRHRVVREQPCSACHDPHSSTEPALLKAPQKVLCLSCHPEVAREIARPTVHRPASDGRCTDCHDPHTSAYRTLLRDALDERFYGAFSTRRFALCFRCHSSSLATAEYGTATGFRDGTKSDHYFHVNDPAKGRSCWVCHEAHGSEQPHLLAQKVEFGRWDLPIIFTENPSGGACLCGCHKRLEYRRN